MNSVSRRVHYCAIERMAELGNPTLAKTFLFAYDATQGNKNVKLVKVTDPRGNATDLAYYSPPADDPRFHWWAKTIRDRLGNSTGFAYAARGCGPGREDSAGDGTQDAAVE